MAIRPSPAATRDDGATADSRVDALVARPGPEPADQEAAAVLLAIQDLRSEPPGR